jgi:hypothetical protein
LSSAPSPVATYINNLIAIAMTGKYLSASLPTSGRTQLLPVPVTTSSLSPSPLDSAYLSVNGTILTADDINMFKFRNNVTAVVPVSLTLLEQTGGKYFEWEVLHYSIAVNLTGRYVDTKCLYILEHTACVKYTIYCL